MNTKQIFIDDLRGKDYVTERGLSPEVVKESRIYTYQQPSEIELNIVRMINGWQTDDEMRFVGAI